MNSVFLMHILDPEAELQMTWYFLGTLGRPLFLFDSMPLIMLQILRLISRTKSPPKAQIPPKFNPLETLESGIGQ